MSQCSPSVHSPDPRAASPARGSLPSSAWLRSVGALALGGLLLGGAACSTPPTSAPSEQAKKGATSPPSGDQAGAGTAVPAGGEGGGAGQAAASGTTATGSGPRLRAEGQGYVVEVEAPTAAVALGSTAQAAVVLTPTGGYKVNLEFPTALEVTPPPGAEVTKTKQVIADAAEFGEKGARFVVPFVATQAGALDFAASFKFAVCTAESCDPKREKLAWTVQAIPTPTK